MVLLVCMFLPWFDGEVGGRGRAPLEVPSTTGWEAFGGVFDLLIVALAAVPLYIAVAKAIEASPVLPLEQHVLVLGAGVLLVVVVGVRLIDPPNLIDVAIPGLEIDTSRKRGAFVALLAASAVAAGGYMQRR